MVVPHIVNDRLAESGMAQRHKLKVAQLIVVHPKVAWHKDKNQKVALGCMHG